MFVYKDTATGNYRVRNTKTGAIVDSNANPDTVIATAVGTGTVRFAPDEFVFSSGFTGLSIPANCSIYCSLGTFFTVPQGYTGYVFKMGTGNPSTFVGGQIREAGTPAHLWTAFKLQSSSSSGIRTDIRDVQITNPGTGIKLLVDNVAGFINSCHFDNIWIFQPTIGVDMEISGTTWSGGDQSPSISHNNFTKVDVQCYSGTTYAWKNIQNLDNVFVNCNSWDANQGNAGAGCPRSHFHPTDNVVGSHLILEGIMTSTTAAQFSDVLGAASIWDRFTGVKPNKEIQATINLGNNVYTIKSTQAILKQGGTSQWYIRNAADSAYGNLRMEKLEFFSLWSQDASTNYVTTSGNIWKFPLGIVHDNYIDMKTITIPADGASTYLRLYPKAADANTDSLYVKAKLQGAVTEMNFFP